MIMKNKTSLKLLSLTIAGALTCSLVACKGFSKSEEESASSSEVAASSSKTELLTTLTDQELQELISGEVTIDQLAEKHAEEAAESVSSQGEASSGSTVADSSASAASPDSGASSTETHGASDTASSAASSSTATTEAPYEAEIRTLINQLYAVKSKAESDLNSAIASAKAEYKALPAEKQTQTRKVAICMGKAGELKSLESSCDKEVESIVSQMRTILTENGQPTTLADQAMSTYKAEKSAMYSSLLNKLYS